MSFIDTHAHLDFDQLGDDLPAVLASAKEAGIDRIITVGTTLARSRKCIELAEQYDNVWAAVGVHPADAEDLVRSGVQDELAFTKLGKLAEHPKVVAIGETGFDFYHEANPAKADQEDSFLSQLSIAAHSKLPLIIHSREAERTTVDSIRRAMETQDHPDDEGWWENPGVVHCFTGSAKFAEKMIDLGFLISFTAPVTYPKNDELREVVKSVPLEKIMLETDAPFLPPADKRGQRNEPAYLIETARTVAELKGISVEDLAKATTANAERLFGLT